MVRGRGADGDGRDRGTTGADGPPAGRVGRRALLRAFGALGAATAGVAGDAGRGRAATRPPRTLASQSGGTTYRGPPLTDEGNPRYGAWTHVGIGAGGKTTGVYTTPADPDVVYLRTDVSGTYRSDDSGRRWYLIHDGKAARGTSVDPRDADRVVQARADGLYHAERVTANYRDPDVDAGDVWDRVVGTTWRTNGTYRGAGDVVARDPADPDVLVAVPEADGVYRSTDGGATWARVAGPSARLKPADVRFVADGTCYVCAGSADRSASGTFDPGVFRSTDGGRTWAAVHEGPDGPTEVRPDPAPGRDRLLGIRGVDGDPAVVASTDGGATWTALTDRRAADGTATGTVASAGTIEVVGDDVYLARSAPGEADRGDGAGAVYRLADDGAAWVRHATGAPSTVDTGGWWDSIGGSPDVGAIEALAVDEADPDRWYAAATYAPYVSTDGGRSWAYAGDGVEELVGLDVRADPRPGGGVHCGVADMGYLRLDADGTTAVARRDPYGTAVTTVAVAPSAPDRVYATTVHYATWSGPGPLGRIARSDDGGDAWRAVGDLYDANDADATADLPAGTAPGPWWYANPNWPDRRTDGSTRAPRQPSAVRSVAGLSVHPDDPDHVVIGIGAEDVVRRTRDGGDSWTTVPGTLADAFDANFWRSNAELAVSADRSMVAATGPGAEVQRYDPATGSWSAPARGPGSPVGAGSPWHVARDPGTPGRFAVAVVDGAGGVYESADGGATWRRLHEGRATSVEFHPTDPDRLLVTTADDGPPLVSVDGGDGFEPLPTLPSGGGDHATFVPADTDRVVVGAGGSSYFVADAPEARPFPDGIPGVGTASPGDPDGDGRYEDVNGDGTADRFDAIDLLFGDGDAIRESPRADAVDFDGDGRFGFGDVIALLFE